MNVPAYHVLGLGAIRRALADAAETERGRELALALTPLHDDASVRESLTLTSEARRLFDLDLLVSLGGLPEIGDALAHLAVENRTLDASRLLALAQFSRVAERARKSLGGQTATAPRLAELGATVPELESVAIAVESVLDAETETVRDGASELLTQLRRELERAERSLKRAVEQILSSRAYAKLLQEPLVTTRNGRSVVPVKAECKSQFPGIVHGASASGATVFVEPLAAVEIGNELTALADRESQEVRRILAELTERIRPERTALSLAGDVLGEVDRVQAQARLSAEQDGVEPRLSESELSLVDARHPLLTDPVPISFSLRDGRRGLIFTGPNTGGKTVALKTAGLLSLMTLCGLHVPADPATTIPVFASVFADIGDDQSLASNLSTFSAHLSKVVEMERTLELPALVILDEVGTGTDPSEGGALGTALVEHFLARGALVVASTHHGLLKAYASTTDGIGAASFQFDPKTYAPTYRVLDGEAGRSLAFEMAERLGLPKPIVERARQLQGEQERQVAELQDRLEEEGVAVEAERRRLQAERREATAARARIEEEELEARREHSRRLAELRETISAELSETRRELVALVAEARRARREQEADVDELEQRLERRLGELTPPLLDEPEAPVEPPVEGGAIEIAPGVRVLVERFGLQGEVTRIVSETEVEVVVHDKKLRLPLAGLEPLAPSPARGARVTTKDTLRGRVTTSSFESKSTPSELNVIGCTVDEALLRADKFLDDACLGDHREVRLIHGHGKGRLRTALRDWLTTHPHVAGQKSDSHDGVTVVELNG